MSLPSNKRVDRENAHKSVKSDIYKCYEDNKVH